MTDDCANCGRPLPYTPVSVDRGDGDDATWDRFIGATVPRLYFCSPACAEELEYDLYAK